MTQFVIPDLVQPVPYKVSVKNAISIFNHATGVGMNNAATIINENFKEDKVVSKELGQIIYQFYHTTE